MVLEVKGWRPRLETVLECNPPKFSRLFERWLLERKDKAKRVGAVARVLRPPEQMSELGLRVQPPHQSKVNEREGACVVWHQMLLCTVDQWLSEYLVPSAVPS